MSGAYPCPHCGKTFDNQLGYICSRCGRHNDALYRLEHADPRRARGMTPAMIQREYRLAGQVPTAAMTRHKATRT